MESGSQIDISHPSFNRNPSNDIADIADRVVQELRLENGFENDVFSFSDDDDENNASDTGYNDAQSVKRNEEKNEEPQEEEDDDDDDEHEFEFPVVCSKDSNSSPVLKDEKEFEDHISLRYPVFDRSLLSEIDFNFNSGLESKPAQRTRPSLRKLLSEERDSPSTSSSEADDLDGIAPGTYCVWKPKTEPRGKHKKSYSISIGSTSKKWKVRDLLKRSFSDDSYSSSKDSPVVVFIPPVSPKQMRNNNEKVNKVEKSGKINYAVGGGAGSVGSMKAEKKIPAYKSKVGNLRLPSYIPYRQDQVAAFANFTGSNPNLYRY